MSKTIIYNDYIQVNPDERILTLDKWEKVKIVDQILNRSYSGGKGLLITYDLSHSGRKINNRVYSTKGQQRGIDSLTNPYPKPIIKNHNMHGEPIGRFVGGEWQDLSDLALNHLRAEDSYWDVRDAFISDEPERIYKTLKKHNLLDDKRWPGLGRMRVQANITDEDAIKKFMDGRYLTFSAGSTTDRHVCSICNQDWAKDGMCEHRHGKMYDGEKCIFVTGDFLVLEGSVVNSPADDLSQLVSMEMKDELGSCDITERFHGTNQILFTDSSFNFGEEDVLRKEERIQDSVEINAQEEEKYQEEKEEKEQVMEDKEFDHMLIIPEEKMKQLHSTGKADVIAASGDQRMTIRLVYRTKENTPGGEDSFGDRYISFEEFIEESFVDEKMFKVPAGAKGNAKKVLEWKAKHGSEVKGMTPVGWARARQLASKSEIGLSTVRRMAAFNRHRKNAAVAPEFKETPWKDRGYVAWLGWGGTSGIDWAVKTSAANKDSLGEEIGDYEVDAYKSSPKGKGAKTPAKPSERIKGSKKNKEGSASSAKNSIQVSERILATLKEKVSSHNEKHGSKPGKKVSLGMLKAVWRRGAGAFSSSHRPGMSRDGWGVARVNAFLKLVRSGSPSNPKYKQDNDLLPAGHPKKSSNKSKDYNMSEELLNEDQVVIQDPTEEDLEVTLDAEEETVEATVEEQEAHDASFNDEEVIDWDLLDLALEGLMGDARLTTEQRNELPDSAFCGPERSFPVPDCAHVTAAKRLIGRAKASDSTKAKIMACVNKKAENMSCNKSEDYLELEEKYNSLKENYDNLASKLELILEKFAEKNEDSSQKDSETVENSVEEQVSITDEVIENPSEHIDEESEVNLKRESNLGSFEQKVVDTYDMIKKDHGELAAEQYLVSKASYLPRGFHPNNI
mgnify:CR=1 FL=1